jgi:hypothetical protein
MSYRRVFLVAVAASIVVLAVGIGPRIADTAQALPLTKELAPQGVTIPYPGRLTDEAGHLVVEGAYDFAFALYETETGGEPLWSEVQEGIMIRDGAFVATLGSADPIPSSILDGTDRWLAVGVRGSGEAEFSALNPRQRVSASTPTMPGNPSAGAACPHDHWGESWGGFGSTDGLSIGTASGVGLTAWSDTSVGVIGVGSASSYPVPVDDKYGVYGYSYSDHGVYGRTNGDWGWVSGVYGQAAKDNAHGVTGWNTGGGPGVYGHSETGFAGYFDGPVDVLGYLYKTGGGFKIDHPLAPATKYLHHSFVESPDMKNIYDGVVVLDADGAAWVELPEWFEAVNKDFRYQLTPIGAPAPDLYIAQEVESSRFRIAGGEAGLKVSWQVTGIRHDPYAEAHPIPVEEDKPPEEQGSYLHPVEHGQPETVGLNYRVVRDQEGLGGEP